jgi:hypothetical protein
MRQMDNELKEEKRIIVPRKAVSNSGVSSFREKRQRNREVKISIGKTPPVWEIQFTRLIDGSYQITRM